MQGVSDNAYDTAAVVSVEQFRVTAQTPIAIFSFGLKDFPFGTGATLSNNTRTEAFMTLVPYGPLSIIHGIFLSQGAATDGYNESPDGGRKNTLFQCFFFRYDAAALSAGGGWIGRYHHMGWGDLAFPSVPKGPPAVGEMVATDTSLNFWLVYLKYNNGRFFANAEYSWANIDTYKTLNGGPPAATATPPFPSYSEYQHAFAEAGFLYGPAKATLVWAWAPGQNLANPLNNPAGTHATKSTPYPINYQAMEPYNTLMFHTFAGGNNQFSWLFGADGTGLMADAWALGARLDYALASNLNAWGSYLWAERLERDSYLAGQFGAVGTPDAVNGAQAAGAAFRALRGGTDPFASSRFLGWEANAGVDWKLLEGMTLHFKYAYWQPGDWFDWAYQAALPGGVTGPLGKSPILSLEGSIRVVF